MRTIWSAASRINTRENSRGSALVMVLIMVVIMTVSMASVAMLNASASTTLKNSATDSETRSAKVADAFAQAVNFLSYDSSGQPRRFGMANDDCGVGADGLLGTYSGVSVYCKSHAASGLNTAVASLILTGSCGASCTVGTDAGLWADIASAPGSSCVSSNGVTTRLKFSAGIVNVSGAWREANCGTIEFGTKGKITQPSTATCPGSGIGSWWAGSSAASLETYAKCVQDNVETRAEDISPTSESSSLKSFMSSISDGVVTAQGTPAMETVPGNGCVVIVRNGVLTSSVLSAAEGMMANSCSTPTIFFANVDSGSMGRVRLAGTSYSLSNTAARLVFGQPNASYTDCDTTKPGTQLQFSGASSLTVGGFTLLMCDPKNNAPSIVAPASYDSSASFSLSNSGDFLTTNQGTIIVRGYVFAPGGSMFLKFNGGSAKFDSGAMLRALHFQASANPDDFGNIPQPPELSGDRLVQLRFKEGDRDLGYVQLILRDYYGRRQAVGIGFKSWRTLW